MFRIVLDQRFSELSPRSGDWHRQRDFQRLLRFGIDPQAIATIDITQRQFDPRDTSHNAVIVGCGERQGCLAFIGRFKITRARHRRFGVALHDHVPDASVIPNHGHLTGLLYGQIKRGGRIFGIIRQRIAANRFVQAQCTGFAVEPHGQLGPVRRGQHRAVDIVQVNRRQAGVGRRLHPAFPCGASGLTDACAAKSRDRLNPQNGPKQKCGQQNQQGEIAKGEGIRLGDTKIGFNRPRLGQLFAHAFLMRTPQSGRRRILRPDSLII